jgi:hypothetical protein
LFYFSVLALASLFATDLILGSQQALAANVGGSFGGGGGSLVGGGGILQCYNKVMILQLLEKS